MAATDQTYRKQYTLDIVFGASSVLMLVSIVLMFAQDYYRPFKTRAACFPRCGSGHCPAAGPGSHTYQGRIRWQREEPMDIVAKRKEKRSDGKTTDEYVKELKDKIEACAQEGKERCRLPDGQAELRFQIELRQP